MLNYGIFKIIGYFIEKKNIVIQWCFYFEICKNRVVFNFPRVENDFSPTTLVIGVFEI